MRQITLALLLLIACAKTRKEKSPGTMTIDYDIEVPVSYLPNNRSPCYPVGFEKVGGRVEAKFVVDTIGRVEVGTIEIVSTTNPVFIRPVLDVLPGYRFEPAWLTFARRKVSQLVIAPFDFIPAGAPVDSVTASHPPAESCKK